MIGIRLSERANERECVTHLLVVQSEKRPPTRKSHQAWGAARRRREGRAGARERENCKANLASDPSETVQPGKGKNDTRSVNWCGSGSDRHERRVSSEGFVKLVGRQSSQYTYARDEHLRFQRIHVLTFLENSDWSRPFACVDCVERARQSWVRWLIRPRGG